MGSGSSCRYGDRRSSKVSVSTPRSIDQASVITRNNSASTGDDANKLAASQSTPVAAFQKRLRCGYCDVTLDDQDEFDQHKVRFKNNNTMHISERYFRHQDGTEKRS